MKKNIIKYLLLLSILPAAISAQDFDESFLSSLPENVREDLLNQKDKKDSLEEVQYRRPSTFIKKQDPNKKQLPDADVFGAEIFSMMQSTFMPINEPNFDGSYILDFGDVLELQLIGQKSSIEKLVIKRDGSINLKDIGKINIEGLPLSEAVNLIKTKINQSFIGVEAYVTLTNVRDIQIIMAGDLYNPGPYTLNGNSNIFHALSVAGGPSSIGSYRSIDLIRNNEKIETIDLYQTFIYGKGSFNKRLRSGDIVFVNPVNKIINITGAVKRPGKYEIIANENLDTLIKFSNGLNAYADLNNIQFQRIINGVIESIPVKTISEFKNIDANDGDSIFIRQYPFRSIEIQGAVLNPGTYLMNEGDNLNDAIRKAGGLTKAAYSFGSVFENKKTEEINKEALQKLYEESIRSISDIVKETASQSDFSPLVEIISELKDVEPSGRVIIDLDSNDEDSMLIQNGDMLLIPEKTNQVYLYGAIASNGAALHQPGKNIDYYIQKKGGFSGSVDKDGIYVLYPNGESVQIKISKNVFKNQAKKIEIYPGSIIYVPQELNTGYSSMLKSQAYATIIGNLGVSLASISVLKD